MVDVTGSQDCGNSPKNQFAQDVAVALESGQLVPGVLSDDVVWRGLSAKSLEGLDAIRQFASKRPTPKSIIVEHAIAHGKTGVANGLTTLANGKSRRFSHVFDFTSAKGNCFASISSYR